MNCLRNSVALILLAAATAAQAQGTSFYRDLFQRGIADVQAGKDVAAVRELRIAAFGMLDSLPEYETAYIYLTVANNRLKRIDDAREAAEKVVLAERISQSYSRLTLDPTMHLVFESLLPTLLNPEQVAVMHRAPAPAVVAVAVAKPAPAVVQPPPAKVVAVAAPVAAPPKTSTPPPVPRVVATPKPAPKPSPAPPPAPAATETVRIAAERPEQRPQEHVSPLVAAAKHQPSEAPIMANIGDMLAAAAQQLNEGKILAARQSYLSLSKLDGLRREAMLEVARGLNHTSAWHESSMQYEKAFPLQRGEEMDMFWEAVNRYELADYHTARELLARALPVIPATREVSLYRSKIEAAP